MKYACFEDTPVWQASQDLAAAVFALVEDPAFDGKGDLRNQLQRAALSVGNNIAEGFERGTTADLIWFLYIARGSAGEVRSALRTAVRLAKQGTLRPKAPDCTSAIERLIPLCLSVSRQLWGWANSLQNSDIKGPRHLNDDSRAAYDQARRSTGFMDKLRRFRAGEAVDWGEKEDG